MSEVIQIVVEWVGTPDGKPNSSGKRWRASVEEGTAAGAVAYAEDLSEGLAELGSLVDVKTMGEFAVPQTTRDSPPGRYPPPRWIGEIAGE